ncbi:MAG TPA: sensor domain-containing diguanylate cyclase [Candidatus Elarobacter sp.]|nr:sensor domain-containing diguanylate cyclase [Candidatus Elarobacter sp.]
MLSVATAPIDARQRFVAIAVIFVLTAVTFALLPGAAVVLPAAPGFVPSIMGVALAAQLVTAYLLMSQFVSSRLVGTAFLGGAYLVGGLSVLAYGVTYPGVLGNVFAPQVAPWVWMAWHFEFPLAVCVALWFDRDKRFAHETSDVRRWLSGVAAGAVLAVAIPAVILAMLDSSLPSLMHGPGPRPLWQVVERALMVLVNLFALGLAVWWTQGRTVLQSWLIVALVAACLDTQISLSGGTRYALGWYAGRSLVLCSSAAVLYAYLRQMDALFGRLRDLSMVDGLTALANRRFFESRLLDEIRAAHRRGRPLALALADVDGFKQYNDTYGHLAGDEALRSVANALRLAAMRPGDVVARWGGEEFVAVFPETDAEGAYQVAERLRAAVAALALPHRRSPLPCGIVTISVGLAMLGGRADDAEALIARADAALYRAKSAGRNGVAVELAPPAGVTESGSPDSTEFAAPR